MENTGRRPSSIGVSGLVLLVVLAGCGDGTKKPTAHLRGTVMIDGQPIPADAEASITFQATRGGQAHGTSAMIVNGKYDAPDVPKGPITVHISVQQPTGREVTENVSRPYKEYRSLVSAEYEQGIPLEVQGDKADQDFDL